MVSLEQLAALDLTLWLTATKRAAELEGTNQTTILRRAEVAQACFGVSIERQPTGWSVAGDGLPLLELERRIHQRARLVSRRPLRLHAPYWTLRAHHGLQPQGWCSNPASATSVCENPLALLRARVIDAALLTSSQLQGDGQDLACTVLYTRPLELTFLGAPAQANPDVAVGRRLEWRDLPLRQPAFIPRSCRLRCQEWNAELRGLEPADATRPARNLRPSQPGAVAFLTPEMRLAQALPYRVDHTVATQLYEERLVMLADLALEPPLMALREHLERLFKLH